MASYELSRLARILINLSDNSTIHWASICGFEAANAAGWLRGQKEKLSEKNVVRLLKALSLDPDTLELDPSRVHVWFVAVHETDTLADAAAFLRPPVEMALVAPDPDGPATFSQGPQLALVRAKDLRSILLRKLFTTKMSEDHVPKKAGTPWIGPSRNSGSPMEGPGDPSDGRHPSHPRSGPYNDRSRKRERLDRSFRRPIRPGGSLGLERRPGPGQGIGLDGPGHRRNDQKEALRTLLPEFPAGISPSLLRPPSRLPLATAGLLGFPCEALVLRTRRIARYERSTETIIRFLRDGEVGSLSLPKV